MSEIDLTEYDGDVFALRDGHIAVSPFTEYPGEIEFPKVFTGALYKAYLEAFENWDNRLNIMQAWPIVEACKPIMKVQGMPSNPDDMDLRLVRWAVAASMRWINPFLTERPWLKTSGNGTPNKAHGHG